jgi:hypothetical protein
VSGASWPPQAAPRLVKVLVAIYTRGIRRQQALVKAIRLACSKRKLQSQKDLSGIERSGEAQRIASPEVTVTPTF